MKIAILCHKDFSGNMYNFASAINKYTKHKSIMIKANINPRLQYPTMILLGKKADNFPLIHKIVYSSDVIILKESPHLITEFKLDESKISNKKIIVLLGGWGFRSHRHLQMSYHNYNKINNNVKWAVASLDFLEKEPWMGWIPPCIRIDYLRARYDFSKLTPPLIATSPSRSGSEETKKIFNLLISMLKRRKKKPKEHFQVKVISDVINDTCLEQKARATIFFDRLFDIYGVNSQEAGAFESAVITGSSGFVRDKFTKGFNCPFVFVDNVTTAANVIVELLNDPIYLKWKMIECYKYVKRLHSGTESIKRLLEIVNSDCYTLPKSKVAKGR